MKKSGFKRKTLEEVKAKQAVKRSKLPLGASKRAKSRKSTTSTSPTWIKAIPESNAHGSGTYQKRLWKITSDYVRIRDWYKYNGRCVATGKYIPHWSQGQAGHLKPYSNCNCLFKFDVRNIHLQTASSNKWGNRDDWKAYEAEIERRGIDQSIFEAENNKANGCSMRNDNVITAIENILVLMADLPEKPDYFDRVMHLRSKLQT